MINTIVTGGAGALGRVVVAGLLAQGHRVASVDIAPGVSNPEAHKVLGEVDLADEATVAKAYAEVAADFGSIHALVNLAGGFVWEPVVGGARANWDRMYRMNVMTAHASCKAALPYFGPHGGAIVNIGAAAALDPGSGMAPYGAAKAGVHALTQSLADELKPRGIRVNALLPTIIDTPANRKEMPDGDWSSWISPASIAEVIAFLISPAAGAITGVLLPLTAGSSASGVSGDD